MKKCSGFGHGFGASLPEGLEIDVERCGQIANGLVRAYHDLGLESTVPELRYSVPFRDDPRNLGRFLVFGCAQDSMKPSRFMYKGARDMLLEHGYERLVSLYKHDREELASVAHHYFYESAIRDSAAILSSCIETIEQFDGDPAGIIRGTDNPDVMRKRLSKIHGVGPYVASLMVKNFVRFGFFEPDDYYRIPIKIDRHAIRITVENKGMVFTRDTGDEGIHRSRVSSALEKVYRHVTAEHGIDPIVLDDAKWAVGAHILGAYQPGFLSQWGLDFSQRITLDDGTYLIWPQRQSEPPLFTLK